MTDSTEEMDPREKVFRAWAPQESIWSPWVKPVLFAGMYFLFPPPRPDRIESDLSWISEGDRSAAFVFDLPGASGVWASPELMKKGLRPVPLYNALPSPIGSADEGGPIVSRVDVVPIVNALWHMAGELQGLALAPTAPPVFLLDSNRTTGNVKVQTLTPEPTTPIFTFELESPGEEGDVEVGDFDNRSVSFPTDFPSGNLLLSRNINRVIVVQSEGTQPQEDLAHTLRRWQDAGIRIELKALNTPSPPALCIVQKPPRFRGMLYQILAKLGFSTSNRLGGFGRMVNDFASG